MSNPPLEFKRVPGISELYDVPDGSTDLGIVWQRGATWYADPNSMLDLKISAPTREWAAEGLRTPAAELAKSKR